MKKVNLITALFLANLFLAAGVYAQGDNSMVGYKDIQQMWGDGKTRQTYAKAMAKGMQAKIGLTDDQVVKVVQVFDTYFAGLYNALRYMNSGVITGPQVGTVAEYRVQEAGLDWSAFSEKLIKNGWAEQANETEVRFKVDLDQGKGRMSKVFGDDFSKILLILQQAQVEQKINETNGRYNASLAQILTPEQMVKWQALQPKAGASSAQVTPPAIK